jgi:hypothetical protein
VPVACNRDRITTTTTATTKATVITSCNTQSFQHVRKWHACSISDTPRLLARTCGHSALACMLGVQQHTRGALTHLSTSKYIKVVTTPQVTSRYPMSCHVISYDVMSCYRHRLDHKKITKNIHSPSLSLSLSLTHPLTHPRTHSHTLTLSPRPYRGPPYRCERTQSTPPAPSL